MGGSGRPPPQSRGPPGEMAELAAGAKGCWPPRAGPRTKGTGCAERVGAGLRAEGKDGERPSLVELSCADVRGIELGPRRGTRGEGEAGGCVLYPPAAGVVCSSVRAPVRGPAWPRGGPPLRAPRPPEVWLSRPLSWEHHRGCLLQRVAVPGPSALPPRTSPHSGAAAVGLSLKLEMTVLGTRTDGTFCH